ncbi:MAG TPA: JAB domain-containing protein [Bacteroidetes bacterium]|nr:JAB domain-containing protein [Bacteroidota bacterium]
MTEKNKLKSIKYWAEDDRPREKLKMHGPGRLSDAELLAILIGSGTRNLSAVDVARKILSDMDHDLSELAKKTIEELKKYHGIGEAKAITIAAAMELVNRKKFNQLPNRIITSSNDVYMEMFPTYADLQHEEFWVLYLNRKNKVVERKQIGKGGVSSTTVDPKIIFKRALELTASGLVLTHNHPSGTTSPSTEDIRLTAKIKEAAGFLDIVLLDHLIFAGGRYFSFADEGKL